MGSRISNAQITSILKAKDSIQEDDKKLTELPLDVLSVIMGHLSLDDKLRLGSTRKVFRNSVELLHNRNAAAKIKEITEFLEILKAKCPENDDLRTQLAKLQEEIAEKPKTGFSVLRIKKRILNICIENFYKFDQYSDFFAEIINAPEILEDLVKQIVISLLKDEIFDKERGHEVVQSTKRTEFGTYTPVDTMNQIYSPSKVKLLILKDSDDFGKNDPYFARKKYLFNQTVLILNVVPASFVRQQNNIEEAIQNALKDVKDTFYKVMILNSLATVLTSTHSGPVDGQENVLDSYPYLLKENEHLPLEQHTDKKGAKKCIEEILKLNPELIRRCNAHAIVSVYIDGDDFLERIDALFQKDLDKANETDEYFNILLGLTAGSALYEKGDNNDMSVNQQVKLAVNECKTRIQTSYTRALILNGIARSVNSFPGVDLPKICYDEVIAENPEDLKHCDLCTVLETYCNEDNFLNLYDNHLKTSLLEFFDRYYNPDYSQTMKVYMLEKYQQAMEPLIKGLANNYSEKNFIEIKNLIRKFPDLIQSAFLDSITNFPEDKKGELIELHAQLRREGNS